MEKKFKIGDRVIYRTTNQWGTIRGICRNCNPPILDVELDGGNEIQTFLDSLVLFEDKKTAFLTELKELLIKYNAEIFAYQSDFEEVTLAFNIGDDAIEYGYGKDTNAVKITPSNIFDYDK